MPNTPIKIARRRALLARRGLALGSALAFGVTVGLARASHPATAAKTSSGSSASTASTSQTSAASTSQTSSGFGQASVSPSTSSQTPSVSTSAS